MPADGSSVRTCALQRTARPDGSLASMPVEEPRSDWSDRMLKIGDGDGFIAVLDQSGAGVIGRTASLEPERQRDPAAGPRCS